MNEIEKLLQNTDASTVVNSLKAHRYLPKPDVDEIEKQINPLGHEVMDETKRPNKWIKVDTDSPTYRPGEPTERLERVARVALAIQKLIVNRAVSFCFGNPVKLNSTTDDEKEKEVLQAVKRVMYDIKEKSFNRRLARQLFTGTEVAEVWYPVRKDTKAYGFDSKFKLRCGIFSPLLGDTLYPYFDARGDMLAFSREYGVKEGDKFERYFETYTDKVKVVWKMEGASFTEIDRQPNPIDKIPIVFAKQPQTEWADVQNLIDRLEKLLSNFADTNDYHASPKIVVKGTLKGFAKKGEAGGILEVDENGSAEYLSWQNAPESVKLEIETLLKMIYTITQTPDISFESVKGIGAVSGVALELMFLDAHLKVQDHAEVFDEYLQRRVNIIKAYIGGFNSKLKAAAEDLMIEPQITPYMIRDKAAEMKIWSDACAGPIISQQEAFRKAGLSSDPDEDFERYKEEQDAVTQRANSFSFNEPTEA